MCPTQHHKHVMFPLYPHKPEFSFASWACCTKPADVMPKAVISSCIRMGKACSRCRDAEGELLPQRSVPSWGTDIYTGTRPLATSPGKSPIGFCWKCLERKCVLALQAYTRMSEHLLQLSGLPWAKLKCILGLTKVIFSSVPSNSAARVKSRKHILLGFISTC